jgi:hypothetical protein
MKSFCFTVDDNIRFLKELTENTAYVSIFEHPYMDMYLHLHKKYGIKIQLNLFYEVDGFTLEDMSDRFRDEWQKNADWLKLSFHSQLENLKPYEFSGYDEVYTDCANVHREIVRFASPYALAKTTTVHYCRTTADGLRALTDNGVIGLLGLYGSEAAPRTSYQNTEDESAMARRGEIVLNDGMAYAGIDVILNSHSIENIMLKLEALKTRELINIMIHEQYFYHDYPRYQENFKEKLDSAFDFLIRNGFSSVFFVELLPY